MKQPLTAAQYRRVKELKRMSPAEWDAICKRCGVCCLIKVNLMFADDWGQIGRNGGNTAYLRRCCENLDIKSKQCRMYGSRLKCANCCKVTVDTVLGDSLLPASCGYVEYVFGKAAIPANLNWNIVSPISDVVADALTEEQIDREMIPESILWSRYYQKTK